MTEDKRIQPQENREVAQREPGALAMAPDASIGGQMAGSDLRPPLYKLVQRLSRETEDGVEPGMFVGGMEPKDKIRCVILRVQLTRVLWPEEISSGPPVCASDDRVHPQAGGEYEGPCAQCPRRRDRPELEEKPRSWCQPGATILLYDLEEHTPAIMRLAGKSTYDPFKEWLFRARMRPHYGRTWEFPTEIRSHSYQGQKGTYEKAQFIKGQPFSEEEAAEHRELVERLEGVLLTAPEEYDETAGEPVGEAEANRQAYQRGQEAPVGGKPPAREPGPAPPDEETDVGTEELPF